MSSSPPSGSRSDPSKQKPTSTKIFQEACNGFRAQLSKEHRAQFVEYPDAESMLKAIREEVATDSEHGNIFHRCCQKIECLANRLTPFFKVIDIFVSSNPTFAAIAWGSIRLVFLLAINNAEFIQKISDMFNTMGSHLPAYEQFVNEFTVATLKRDLAANSRLTRALAYIYSDLIQFCYDICQLFSRRRSKLLSFPGSFIYSSLWKPFNHRFDTLLQRWKEHKEIIDLELHVAAASKQLRLTTKLDEKLEKKLKQFEDATIESKQELCSDDILRQLRYWINAPPFMHAFEAAQERRAANSTEWFMKHPIVSEWVQGSSDSERNSFKGIHVSAKPGYGKTTICTKLIESISQSLSKTKSPRHWIAYFFFDKQRQESTRSTGVWRSILTQLLDTFPKDENTIDTSIILRDKLMTGQLVALNSEVIAILKVVLARFDHLYFIFDGVDECIDQAKFFDDLHDICNSLHSSSVALFSRPTIIIPNKFKDHTTRMPLDAGQNLEDIRNFMQSSMSKLSEVSALPLDLDPENVVVELSARAGGMFLWAKLFVEYICSPNLSIRQRRDAIRDINRFDDLDRLFEAILQVLLRGSRTSAKGNIVRALKLVAFSHRPLHVNELQYAIAIPFDRAATMDDIIPGFVHNLGHLSGALLELDANDTVRFIHLSVLEYLFDTRGTTAPPGSTTDIEFDYISGHRLCASISLSYLSTTVQPAPLAGSVTSVPNVKEQTRKYPFLDYAAEFWSFHVVDYLDLVDSFPINEEDEEFLRLASKFLSQKSSIMVWIEASWMFGRPPRIRNGPTDAKLRRYSDETESQKDTPNPVLERAYQGLLQLARHLELLNSAWHHVLSQQANEIWGPSISTFNASPFWTRVPGGIVAPFEIYHDRDLRSVCLKSSVSHDGSLLAIARLYISEAAHHREFQAYFEHWRVNPVERLFEHVVEVPYYEMFNFMGDYYREITAVYEFKFPVAITADLNRAIMPGCVIDVDSFQESVAPTARMQQIDFAKIAAEKLYIERSPAMDFGDYDIQVSDNGRYLVTVHRLQHVEYDETTTCNINLVTAYQDEGISRTPKYTWLASLVYKPDVNARNREKTCTLLHPILPLVAIKFDRYITTRHVRHGMKRISPPKGTNSGLWDISSNGSQQFRATNMPRNEELCFQNNGNDLYGIHLSYKDWGKVPGARPIYDTERSHGVKLNNMVMQFDRPRGSKIINCGRGNLHVQRQGDIIHLTDDNGSVSASQLRMNAGGEVVFGTLRDDGKMSAELITRLPYWALEDREVSLLKSNGVNNDTERRILISPSNEPFKRHSLIRDQNQGTTSTNTPMVINRKRKTIPTEVRYVDNRSLSSNRIDYPDKRRKRIYTGALRSGVVDKRGGSYWRPRRRR
ncbi:hypothetical protein F5Y04DRAFT_209945 [Hypomontagnella monticulosa]|nr:hypothetical protein F5Y04DRAFT_209945 [Hypomontagnella monticulosa]